ncbi:hypothetical protein ABVX93_002582 [Escherichia coli]|nr:hypothetical protein [Escherichia coli]
MTDNTTRTLTGFWGHLFEHLRQIKSFRQVLITLLMTGSVITGYALWEYRREITLAAVSKFGVPEIDESHTESVADELMRTTSAESISVWSVNMQTNERILLYFRLGHERQPQYEGISDLAMQAGAPHTDEMIRLINHKTICHPTIITSHVDEISAKAGITHTCAASIPPSHGIFLGFITAGFKDEPTKPDYVKMRLASAAQKMMK